MRSNRGHDLKVRPSGYEPDEAPCGTLILEHQNSLLKIAR